MLQEYISNTAAEEDIINLTFCFLIVETAVDFFANGNAKILFSVVSFTNIKV